MAILAWVTGLIAVAGFAMAGFAKLTDQDVMVDARQKLGFDKQQFQAIGGAEVAGGLGVLIGLFGATTPLKWVGVLAGLGLTALAIGAVVHHLRAGDDGSDMGPALGLGLAAVVFVVAMIAQ